MCGAELGGAAARRGRAACESRCACALSFLHPFNLATFRPLAPFQPCALSSLRPSVLPQAVCCYAMRGTEVGAGRCETQDAASGTSSCTLSGR
eukprot:1832996-Rhodomonas_salina.1